MVNVLDIRQNIFPQTTGNVSGVDHPLFGPPPDAGREPNALDRVNYTHFTGQDYFRDKSKTINKQVSHVVTFDNDWPTSLALPWVFTEDTTIRWNSWLFNQQLAERTPEEATSRLVSTTREDHESGLVRKGYAMMLEIDSMHTPAGIEMYRRNLLGIAQGIRDTQGLDTVWELLEANTYEKMWNAKFGISKVSAHKVLEDEITNFGHLMFKGHTLEILYERIKRIMEGRSPRVSPSLLIMPPEAAIYLTMTSDQRTTYYKAGPNGMRYLQDGPRALGSFRDGTSIVEARDYIDHYLVEHGNLLTRSIQIAEYYTMFAPFDSETLDQFETKYRDIYIYDNDQDNWAKIRFTEAFENLHIFDHMGESNDYNPALIDYINRCNNKKIGNLTANDNINPFPLAARDDQGQYNLIKWFGQMDLKSATHKHFLQIGQSIFGHMCKESTSINNDVWDRTIKLINLIESEPYDREYWEDLIKMNEPHSIDISGTFLGQQTPKDVMKNWGNITPLTEWTPNQFGSLRLPNWKKSDRNVTGRPIYPSGYANAPGLRTLAKEAGNTNSHWQAAGQQALESLEMLDKMIKFFGGIFNTSEALNAKNRSPWFHKPDSLTTFFEKIVSVTRPPLWIAALDPVKAVDAEGEEKDVIGKTYGGRKDSEDIMVYPAPMFVFDSENALTDTISDEEVIQNMKELYDKNLGKNTLKEILKGKLALSKHFVYKSVVTGNTITIPEQFLKRITMIPADMRVIMLMGRISLPALRKIYSIINDPKKYEKYDKNIVPGEINKNRRRLSEFILGFVQENDINELRNIIMQLAVDVSPKTLFSNLAQIHIPLDDSSEQKAKEAGARITELLKLREPRIKDKNLPDAPSHLRIAAFNKINGNEIINLIAKDESLSLERESLEKILDAVAEINDIQKIYDTKTTSFNVASPFEFNAAINGLIQHIDGLENPSTLDFDNSRKLQDNLDVINGERNKLISDHPIFEGDRGNKIFDEAKQRFRPNKLNVADTPRAVITAVRYRSPLTISFDLLKSLEFAGAAALISVSDPRFSHNEYFRGGDEKSKPDQPIVIPEAIWRTHEYANLSAKAEND